MAHFPTTRFLFAFVLALTGLLAPLYTAADQAVTLSIRETSGGPLEAEATLRIASSTHGGDILVNTGGGNNTPGSVTVTLAEGEYDVEVSAPNYNTTTEHVTVSMTSGRQVLFITLTRVGAKTSPPFGGTVMAPAVQKELDKALAAMRQQKYEEARKHLSKVLKLVPSNPDFLYLLAVLDFSTKDVPAAREDLEAALALNPNHARSLVMLGQIQLEANELPGATATLLKAVTADPFNYRPHYLLGICYIKSNDLPNAASEIKKAGDLSKEQAPGMRFLHAKILLVQGKDTDALEEFRAFRKEYPTDHNAEPALNYIHEIETAQRAATVAKVSAADAVPKLPAVSASSAFAAAADHWSPPDLDSSTPPTAADVACSLPDVLAHTQTRIIRQLADMEKFTATETIQHQSLSTNGVWSAPLSKEFSYLIFVHRSQALPYYFVESRHSMDSSGRFPTNIVTFGLVPLGFMIVNPAFSGDFQMKCEGLGSWKGKPAWQIHFSQIPGKPSRVRSFVYRGQDYPVALKGRLWIGANNYNLLHIETSLVEPVPALGLNHEQLFIDYGPVHFQSSKAELWLPWKGEMYFEMLGHRYHHTHSLTDYLLFDVDTHHKIKTPELPPPPPDN